MNSVTHIPNDIPTTKLVAVNNISITMFNWLI